MSKPKAIIYLQSNDLVNKIQSLQGAKGIGITNKIDDAEIGPDEKVGILLSSTRIFFVVAKNNADKFFNNIRASKICTGNIDKRTNLPIMVNNAE
jgi:hypothetical protein